MNNYRGHGLQIHTSDINPIQSLGGITDFSFENRAQMQQEMSGDSAYPNFVYIPGYEEVLRITTLNVSKYFSIFGAAVTCIKGTDGTHTGLDFYSALWDECSNGPASGSVHRKYSLPVDDSSATLSTGIVIPNSLSLDHQGNARLTFEIHFKGKADGNTRLVTATGQTLPAAIADDQTRYTIGKTTIGSNQFQSLKSVNMQFNARLIKESADSLQRPTRIGLNSYAPVLTFDGIDPTWIDSIAPIAGKAATHANSIVYLRKRDADGIGFVADGTAEHIKMTAAGLLVPTSMISGNVGQFSKSAVSLQTKFDGTNVPVVITTAQAIT